MLRSYSEGGCGMKHIGTVMVESIGINEQAPDGSISVLSLGCASVGDGMDFFIDVDASSAPAIGEMLRVTVEWGDADEQRYRD